MIFKQPELAQDGIKVGDKIKGKVLMGKYSRYMQNIAQIAPQLAESIAEEGCRLPRSETILFCYCKHAINYNGDFDSLCFWEDIFRCCYKNFYTCHCVLNGS